MRMVLTLGERLLLNCTVEDHCWIWTGAKIPSGYGHIWVPEEHEVRRVHRVAYEVWRGPIADGLHVCHTCDRPLCVNPSHLFLGTDADNNADMVAKDRHARGERNGHARLTEDAVRAIRADQRPQTWIAHDHGISQSMVSQIKSGRRWAHVR